MKQFLMREVPLSHPRHASVSRHVWYLEIGGLDPRDLKTALVCTSFLRKGEVLAYVGLPQNLQDLKGCPSSGQGVIFAPPPVEGRGKYDVAIVGPLVATLPPLPPPSLLSRGLEPGSYLPLRRSYGGSEKNLKDMGGGGLGESACASLKG